MTVALNNGYEMPTQNAMEHMNDKDMLAAYARDESAWHRRDAIRRMHTGKLIAQVGLESGTHHTAAAWTAAWRPHCGQKCYYMDPDDPVVWCPHCAGNLR